MNGAKSAAGKRPTPLGSLRMDPHHFR